MGCPPDPMDISLSNGNKESSALKDKADMLTHELEKSAAFLLELSHLFKQVVPEKTASDAQSFLKNAIHFKKADLGKTFYWEAHDESGHRTMSNLYGHLNDAEKTVKSIEITLCICRHQLLQTVKQIGEDNLSEKDRNLFKKEFELHLLHRRDDKQTKLASIDHEINRCTTTIANDFKLHSVEEIETAKNKIPVLEAERKKVEAFTDEQLLNDRDLF